MDCACVYATEGDTPEFSNTSFHKAIKVHKCCECGKEIKKGDRYEKTVGKWDGEIDTYKTCSDCALVRSVFFCGNFTYTYLWSDLHDHIFDMYGDIASSCLVNLTKPVRDRICDLIEDAWEYWEVKRKRTFE